MEEPAFSNWHGSVHSAGQNAPLIEFLGEICYLGRYCGYYFSGNAIGVDSPPPVLWKTLSCQSCISPEFVREGNKTVWQLITITAVGLKRRAWQVLLADRLPLQSPDRNVRLNKNPSDCASEATLAWECAGRGLWYFRNLLPWWFVESPARKVCFHLY